MFKSEICFVILHQRYSGSHFVARLKRCGKIYCYRFFLAFKMNDKIFVFSSIKRRWLSNIIDSNSSL